MTPEPVVPLREYVETLMREREKFLQMRFEYAEQALQLATKTLDERLSHMNEFRNQVLEERAKYVTRAELLAAMSTGAALLIVFLRTLGVF